MHYEGKYKRCSRRCNQTDSRRLSNPFAVTQAAEQRERKRSLRNAGKAASKAEDDGKWTIHNSREEIWGQSQTM